MTHQTLTTDQIKKTVELKAPIERVWAALTEPARFGAWFRVKLEDAFTPGQVSRGHMTYPGYEHVTWEATIMTMDRPRLFSFTWHPYAVDPAVDYSNEQPTLVEFKLEPAEGGTRLTVIESGFDAIPSRRREEAMRRNDGGWTAQMENIRAYVDA